jgi:predicted lipoprotein
MNQLDTPGTLFLTIALVTLGCGGNNYDPSPDEHGKDRKIILTHWVDNIIIPSYNNFKVKFDLMMNKSDAFTTAPDLNSLNEFRLSWSEAYAEWQKVELFEFGPADRYTLRNFFNIYPADVAGIAAAINDPSTSLEVPASYPKQGFPALDYLLFGAGQDDMAVIAYYTDASEGVKRLSYVKRIIDRMSTLLTSVISEWNGAYRDTFISKTGLDIGSSFGIVINAYVLHFERYIRTGKIGIPSGATIASSGVPHPEKVEAFYKRDISLLLAKNAHQAVHDFFQGKNVLTGADGPSFQTYLDALNAKDMTSGKLLSVIIDEQFAVVSAKLNALSSSLYDQVQNDNQAMIDTYDAMQQMVRILKVDMTSAMSITITYTDNDGD